MNIHILTRMRFFIPLSVATILLLGLGAGYKALEYFFKFSYVGYVIELPEADPIYANHVGYVRMIHVKAGQKVNKSDQLFDIVVSNKPKLNNADIKQLFRVRLINARLESQQGGLRKILLSPDLRERVRLDTGFANFMNEEEKLFRAFHALLDLETFEERENNTKIKNQVNLISKQLESLNNQRSDFLVRREEARRLSSSEEVAQQLQRIENDLRILDEDITRYVSLHKGLKKNHNKSSLEVINKTLEVRNSVREDFDATRNNLARLFAQLEIKGGNEAKAQNIKTHKGGIVANVYIDRPGDVVHEEDIIASIIDEAENIAIEVQVDQQKAKYYTPQDTIPVAFQKENGNMIYLSGILQNISDTLPNNPFRLFTILVPADQAISEYGRLPEKNLVVGTMLNRGASRSDSFFMANLYEKMKTTVLQRWLLMDKQTNL